MDNVTTPQDLSTNVIITSSEPRPERCIINRPLTARFRKKQTSSIDTAVTALQQISSTMNFKQLAIPLLRNRKRCRYR